MTLHHAIAAAALVLAGGAAIGGSTPRMTAVALAEQLEAGERPRVFDLRGAAEYDQFHIPSAERATVEELRALTLPSSASIVLYSDDVAASARASTLLRQRGYRHVAYLRDGLNGWIVRVHQPTLAVDATPAERAEFERLAALSRYFGGQPRVDVPRGELPAGVATSLLVAAIRRRGC